MGVKRPFSAIFEAWHEYCNTMKWHTKESGEMTMIEKRMME